MEIELNDGKQYTFKPLTLGAIIKYQDKMSSISDFDMKDVPLVLDIIYESFKRSYPEITKDVLSDLVDLSNMKDVFFAVMNVSNMVGSKKSDGNSEEKK